jgi:pentapeptide MXKDX repeat protein
LNKTCTTLFAACVAIGSMSAFGADEMTKKDGMPKDDTKMGMPASGAMAHDGMKKDSMKKDSMKADAMKKDAMKKDAMGKDSMAKDGDAMKK